MNLFKRRSLLLVLFGSAIAISLIIGWVFTHLGAFADQQAKPLSSSQFLKLVADVPLSGGSSRFDYQSLDEQQGRLYIAHLGAGSVTVFDTKAQKVVTNIEELPGVHGVLAVPSLKQVYATATDVNQVAAIDEQTLKIVARTPTGKYPGDVLPS